MKFSWSWLQEHLRTSASYQEIAEALVNLGHEVESIEDRGALLKDFTVAEVLSTTPHPQADRLNVCQVLVDTKMPPVQVVCGAPNVRAGLKVAFAKVGVTIPYNSMVLKLTTIRGVESQGMLCSARELTIAEDHEGILELPIEAILGAPIAEALGLNDPIFDLAITPNRGDCLSVRGIARDLAATEIGQLYPLTESVLPKEVPCSFVLHQETSDCWILAGRLIQNVKNGESPLWLRQRLEQAGVRSISGLVDITNYIMLEEGRPLHAFDADKIHGTDLWVRSAQVGEAFTSLEGTVYSLNPGMIVIADQQGVLSLAGIKGGQRSGCTDSTSSIFLEAALFNPSVIAATGRSLNILSDARYRYERGVDRESVKRGVDRATALILELAGTSETIISDIKQAGRISPAVQPAPFSFKWTEIPKKTALQVDALQAQGILEKLGFQVTASSPSMATVTPPSWRYDIKESADLIEEVARVVGYDHIPGCALPPSSKVYTSALNQPQSRLMGLRHLLAGRGLYELVTWSFISLEQAELFSDKSETIEVENPLNELAVMRSSVLPHLIATVVRNIDRGQNPEGVFEIGPQFQGVEGADQEIAVGIARTAPWPLHWQSKHDLNVFDVKADVWAVMEHIGLNPAKIQLAPTGPRWYHPGRVATLSLGQNVVAYFGEIHPRVRQSMGCENSIVAAEIFVGRCPAARPKVSKPAVVLSVLQPVKRDFAFVMDDTIPVNTLVHAAEKAHKLIQTIEIFDVYSGRGIPEGKKSIAFRATIQPFEATLTDEALQQITESVVQAVSRATGGVLR